MEVDILDLTERDARRAIDSDEPDYEDGLVRAVAEESGIDCIVTPDAAAFHASPVPAKDAAAVLRYS